MQSQRDPTSNLTGKHFGTSPTPGLYFEVCYGKIYACIRGVKLEERANELAGPALKGAELLSTNPGSNSSRFAHGIPYV